MIWNSIPLMTAFDLSIIAVTAYAIWRCQAIGLGKSLFSPLSGRLLIALGPLAVCLFYLIDLVLPFRPNRFAAG